MNYMRGQEMSKLTAGEKEILDAIREQNLRLVVLEEWKNECDSQSKQVHDYLESLNEEPTGESIRDLFTKR